MSKSESGVVSHPVACKAFWSGHVRLSINVSAATHAIAQMVTYGARPVRGRGQSSSHSVMNCLLAWISICRSGPSPICTNLWGVSGGTTMICLKAPSNDDL